VLLDLGGSAPAGFTKSELNGNRKATASPLTGAGGEDSTSRETGVSRPKNEKKTKRTPPHYTFLPSPSAKNLKKKIVGHYGIVTYTRSSFSLGEKVKFSHPRGLPVIGETPVLFSFLLVRSKGRGKGGKEPVSGVARLPQ